ncbi:helix-turn-helix domain-containing protein [Streptomyces sp. NPDC056437]|uniref:helix-turn-helix domain-containing protein n=1 Tax=Streptomyces sp. NPDC056437 TaxID=3345816 RepID=UPI0036830B45
MTADLVSANAVIGDLYRSLGQQVREARLARGVTQGALAVAVGLTRASITNLESGAQRLQVHTLIAVSQALNIDPADLISRALSGEQLADAIPAGAERDARRLAKRLASVRDQINALLPLLPGRPDVPEDGVS